MTPRLPLSRSWVPPLVLLLALLAILRFQPAEDHSPTAASSEWHQAAALMPGPLDSASIDAFDAWLADERHTASIARGVELARARRVALKELI